MQILAEQVYERREMIGTEALGCFVQLLPTQLQHTIL